MNSIGKKIKSALSNIAFPIIAIILSFLVCSIFLKLTGKNPLDAYKALWQGSVYNSDNPGIGTFCNTLLEFTPLALAGLAVGLGFKCGLFNIGAEGQIIIGAIAAVPVGMVPGIPAIIHIPLTLLAGALGGAFWGFIPGFLKAKFGTHEVINGIMLNYVAFNLSNYLTTRVLVEKGQQYTKSIAASAQLPIINQQSSLHIGVIIALAFIVGIYILLNKTTLGYEIKAVGLSQTAAEYGGINIKKNIILAMMISGGLAGLAGAIQTTGIFYKVNQLLAFTNYGFDGMTVALVGKSNPFGILLSALLFACLHTGSNNMQFYNIPKEITGLIQGTIIVFVAAEVGFRIIKDKLKRRPKAEITRKGEN